MIKLAIFLFAVIALSVAPKPPTLPQQFTTNYTVIASNWVTPTQAQVFEGFFALDYINGGLRFEIGGEEFIPIYFHTTFIASPDANQGVITGYMFERHLCWNGGAVDSQWLIIVPFQIPDNASYMGTDIVNGVKCSVWSFVPYDPYTVTVYVTMDTVVISRVLFDNIDVVGTLQWDFFNTQKGPFDPMIYAPPDQVYDVNCTTPFNFRKTMKRFASMLF